MWTKKYSLATLLRCDILNKTNRPSCRVCKIYLHKNNTYASMLKRHNHICKECHKSEVEKRKNILSNNLASNSKENSIELGVKIKDRAIKMMREGKGLPEVSRILGIHENTVRSWKKREIEDRATSEFSKNTASKGASLDDIIGTWGVNKTSIEFEISKNNQNAVTISAWSKKTKEKYQVSEIICNENKNGVLLVIQFQSLWVPRKWKTTWTLYPQRLDGRVDVMRCEYLTQSGHEGESNARRLGIQLHQYKCSKCGFSTTNQGALVSHQKSCNKDSKSQEEDIKNKKKEIPPKCPKCDKIILNKGAMVNHVRACKLYQTWSRNIPKEFVCPWCAKKSNNKGAIESHKRACMKNQHPMAKEALLMIRDGNSSQEVARILGVDLKTVDRWRSVSGLNRNLALEMIKKGVSVVEVTQHLGVHKDTVRKWCKGAGLSGKSSGSSLKEEGLMMIKEGITGAEVARRLGVHPGTVRKWRKAAGLSGKDGTKFHDVDKENDVIDLLREGRSLYHINKSTRVGKKSILRIKADAEREGFL